MTTRECAAAPSPGSPFPPENDKRAGDDDAARTEWLLDLYYQLGAIELAVGKIRGLIAQELRRLGQLPQ